MKKILIVIILAITITSFNKKQSEEVAEIIYVYDEDELQNINIILEETNEAEENVIINNQELDYINKIRQEYNINTLLWNGNLKIESDKRVNEIIYDFSHDGFNLSCGAENIAYGYKNIEDVLNGWMKSEGHRANILNEIYKSVSLSFKNDYWVLLLNC